MSEMKSKTGLESAIKFAESVEVFALMLEKEKAKADIRVSKLKGAELGASQDVVDSHFLGSASTSLRMAVIHLMLYHE